MNDVIDYTKAPNVTGLDPVRGGLTLQAWMNKAHGYGINPQQWLLDNGREFERGPLPEGVDRGEPKQCYRNSLALARRGKGRFVYMEGEALGALIATDHAWCYDRQTGLIVDRTWEKGAHYIGVPVRLAYVRKRIPRGRVVVKDWENNYPVVTGKVGPEVWREEI